MPEVIGKSSFYFIFFLNNRRAFRTREMRWNEYLRKFLFHTLSLAENFEIILTARSRLIQKLCENSSFNLAIPDVFQSVKCVYKQGFKRIICWKFIEYKIALSIKEKKNCCTNHSIFTFLYVLEFANKYLFFFLQ